MRILVTGVDGQVSQCLRERAVGHEVIALGRPQLDLEIAGSAARAVGEAGPDVVINAAAYTAVDDAEDEPERAMRINADAAGEIAVAARDSGARLIQLSTDFVFDGTEARPYRETDPTSPLGAYGRSKLASEAAAKTGNPDHLIVRTAWVYSPFGRNFVKSIMAAAATREVLSVVDDQRGSPTSALDLADGLLAIIAGWSAGGDVGLGQTYHLAGSGEASWCDVARAVMAECKALGLPHAEVLPIATEGWPTRAKRPAYSVLDSSKFTRDFGFVMPDWRQSLGEVVKRLAA